MRRTKLFSAALLALAWLAGGTAWAQHDGDHSYTNGICTIEGCTDMYQAPALVDGWYELTNAGNVEWIGDYVQNVDNKPNVKMMNDIDFTGVSHTMIGRSDSKKFNGVWDGQGHRITNLTLENVTEDANSVLGFFAWVRGGTTIKNLIMDSSCSFHGYKRVSAFVGVTQANNGGAVNILNCVNEATVTANDNPAGAFVGCRNPNNNDTPQIIIDGCVNKGTITARSETAAFVGWANRENNDVGWANHIVRNSYNFGTINNIDGDKRGFFRSGNISIENSYDFGSNKANNNQNVSYAWTTDDPVASGELAYHLNQEASTQVLYQTFGTDDYPVPFSTSDQVYANAEYYCDGTPKGTVDYSNKDEGSTRDPHTTNPETGFCTVCNSPVEGWLTPDENSFYHLSTVNQVEWFSAMVAAGHGAMKVKLDADIDFGGAENAHKPIGTADKKFFGVFDGDGHSIKNMKLDQPVRPKPDDDGIGFFGCVRVGNDAIANVVIKNLTIDSSCEIKGSSNHVAGIVGRIHERTQNNTLLIENCINKANITTTADNVAGIVGQITTISASDGSNVTITIKDCTNEGAITTSGAYAAGIVAQLNSADASTVNVIGCTNKGAVQTAGICAAGIVSQANNCAVALNIESCMNFADVTSTGNKNCGGIHGANTSSKATIRMINCGNMGNVTATTESAALTGWIGSNAGNVITNCWNTGSVTGISNSDNTYRGTATATNVYDKNGGQGTVITDDMLTSGELCYRLNGDQSVIAWTQTLDGTQEYPLPVVDGNQVFAHGKMNCDGTSAPGTLYNNEGPDGIIQTPHDISDEIGMCTFCHTQFQAPALVDGYYEIKNAGNLEWFSNKVDEGGDANLQINAKLMNDIDMLSIENLHKPIGQTTAKKYNGTFDGQGFRIKNMIIERPNDSNIGFFGFLRGNAKNTTVKNLIMDKSCTIHGYNRVGGITGSCQNSSEFTITIENVVNEATIIAEHQDAAGIIGGQQDGGPKWYIHNVLNTGTITAKNAEPYAGALCCYLGGNGESVIENFVNLGTINGHRGGNIGRIAGTRTNIIDLSDTDFESSLETNYGLDTGMTSADIAGGRLAYTVGWWQELGVDAYPMPFEKAGAIVYRTGEERCDGADNENTVYSNTEGTIVTGSHDYNATTGLCDLCGMPNPEFKTLADGFYVLDNVIDMKWFAAMVQFIDPAINGKLTADLDFESGNCRIGTDTNAYRGTFQGGDHVISNFVVDNNEIFQGLFGYVTGGADISGLVFDNTCSIKCNARGAMIGGAKDGGTVKLTRLGNEGNVTTTNENAAGIIGTDMLGACVLQIDQCYSTGTIVGGKESAQIAGWTGNNSLISNSWSCAEVTGVQSGREFSRYGGDNHDGQYVNCFTTYHETNGGLTYDTSAEDFASGKVAYTICKEVGSTIFGQTIGTDATPTFFGPEVSYVGDAGYATMYDNTTGYVLNGDVEAYVAVTATGKTEEQEEYRYLELTEIENVPVRTPVILKGTYYNKFAYDVPAINITNELKGTDADTEPDGTMYVLAKKNDNVGFYLAEGGTIAAGKAYYQPTSNQGVKAFYFSADDATGIEETLSNSPAKGENIYNLAGQRVSKMQKGINIVNGKKILK